MLAINDAGHVIKNKLFFDTLLVVPSAGIDAIRTRAEEKQINLRYFEDGVGIALDETVSEKDIIDLAWVFGSEVEIEKV